MTENWFTICKMKDEIAAAKYLEYVGNKGLKNYEIRQNNNEVQVELNTVTIDLMLRQIDSCNGFNAGYLAAKQ